MTKFKSYILNEGRSKEISEDKAIDNIITHCNVQYNFYKKNPKSIIYRGLYNDGLTVFIDPSKSDVRSSAYENYNFYTLLMNNLPSWKEYPKRSIICTNNYNTATTYGKAFRVFPYDNAKIGVCPSSDIWMSFKKTLKNSFLPDLNNEIYELFKTYLYKFSIEKVNYDWNYFKSSLKMIEDRIENNNDISKFKIDMIKKFLKNPFKEGLIDIFNRELSPQKNGFKLVIPGKTKISGEKEIWIDSPCILVLESYASEIMTLINMTIN